MMSLAVTNQLTVGLTITADPLTVDNTSPSSCANVISTISNLSAIITTCLTNGNLTVLPGEVVGSGPAGEEKGKRDIGYFIDAVSTDLTTLGNSYSIDFVKQYFVEGKVNGAILAFTNTSGTTLLNRADRIYNGVDTTTNGSGAGATFRVTRDSAGVVDSVTVVDSGYGYASNDLVTIPGGLLVESILLMM